MELASSLAPLHLNLLQPAWPPSMQIFRIASESDSLFSSSLPLRRFSALAESEHLIIVFPSKNSATEVLAEASSSIGSSTAPHHRQTLAYWLAVATTLRRNFLPWKRIGVVAAPLFFQFTLQKMFVDPFPAH